MQKYTYLYIHSPHRKIQNSDLFLQCTPCKFMLFFQIKETRKETTTPLHSFGTCQLFLVTKNKAFNFILQAGKAACPGSKMEFWYKFSFSLLYSIQTNQTTPKPITLNNFNGFLSSPNSRQILNAIHRNGFLF